MKLSFSRMMYVRNASGLIRDRARLLHIILILFIVVWMSNRNFMGIIVHSTRYKGHLILSKNICMKTNTTVETDEFNIPVSTIPVSINGFIYDVVLTSSYFIALKNR